MKKAVAYPHIVQTHGTCGGAPRIEGRRVRVLDVAAWHDKQGLSPEEIAEQFGLTLAEVHAALAYYFDHQVELRRAEAAADALVRRMRRTHPSLVKTRLRG